MPAEQVEHLTFFGLRLESFQCKEKNCGLQQVLLYANNAMRLFVPAAKILQFIQQCLFDYSKKSIAYPQKSYNIIILGCIYLHGSDNDQLFFSL